jgi:hypothetical protein
MQTHARAQRTYNKIYQDGGWFSKRPADAFTQDNRSDKVSGHRPCEWNLSTTAQPEANPASCLMGTGG